MGIAFGAPAAVPAGLNDDDGGTVGMVFGAPAAAPAGLNDDDGGTVGIAFGAPAAAAAAVSEPKGAEIPFKTFPDEPAAEEATVGALGMAAPKAKKPEKPRPEKKKKEKAEKPKAEKPENKGEKPKKKTGLIVAAAAALLAVAGALAFFLWPRYGAWSEWSTVMPNASEGRRIETATEYRVRTQTLQSTTRRGNVVGEIDHETTELRAWGPWGEWQTDPIQASDTREVQTREQYSKSAKEYTTSKETELEGWIPDGTTTIRDYGDWTLWRTEKPAYREDRVVSARTQYRCYWRVYKNGKISSRRKYPTNADDWRFTMDYGASGALYKTTKSGSDTFKYYSYYDTRTVYSYKELQDITVNRFYRWKDWSRWNFVQAEESEDLRVETRTVYRCRDKIETPVYYYYDWGEWSEWSQTAATAAEGVEVETRTVYRYADREDS